MAAQSEALLNSSSILEVAPDALGELHELSMNAIDDLYQNLEAFDEQLVDVLDHSHGPMQKYVILLQDTLNAVLTQAIVNLNMLVSRVNWRITKLSTVARNTSRQMASDLTTSIDELERRRMFNTDVFDEFETVLSDAIRTLEVTYIPSDIYDRFRAILKPLLAEISAVSESSTKQFLLRIPDLLNSRLRSPVHARLDTFIKDSNSTRSAGINALSHALLNTSTLISQPMDALKRKLEEFRNRWNTAWRTAKSNRHPQIVLKRAEDTSQRLRRALDAGESEKIQNEIASAEAASELEALRRDLLGRVREAFAEANSTRWPALKTLHRWVQSDTVAEKLSDATVEAAMAMEQALVNISRSLNKDEARLVKDVEDQFRPIMQAISDSISLALQRLAESSDNLAADSIAEHADYRKQQGALAQLFASESRDMDAAADARVRELSHSTENFQREAREVRQAILQQRRKSYEAVEDFAVQAEEATASADALVHKPQEQVDARPVPHVLETVTARVEAEVSRLKQFASAELIDVNFHKDAFAHKRSDFDQGLARVGVELKSFTDHFAKAASHSLTTMKATGKKLVEARKDLALSVQKLSGLADSEVSGMRSGIQDELTKAQPLFKELLEDAIANRHKQTLEARSLAFENLDKNAAEFNKTIADVVDDVASDSGGNSDAKLRLAGIRGEVDAEASSLKRKFRELRKSLSLHGLPAVSMRPITETFDTERIFNSKIDALESRAKIHLDASVGDSLDDLQSVLEIYEANTVAALHNASMIGISASQDRGHGRSLYRRLRKLHNRLGQLVSRGRTRAFELERRQEELASSFIASVRDLLQLIESRRDASAGDDYFRSLGSSSRDTSLAAISAVQAALSAAQTLLGSLRMSTNFRIKQEASVSGLIYRQLSQAVAGFRSPDIPLTDELRNLTREAVDAVAKLEAASLESVKSEAAEVFLADMPIRSPEFTAASVRSETAGVAALMQKLFAAGRARRVQVEAEVSQDFQILDAAMGGLEAEQDTSAKELSLAMDDLVGQLKTKLEAGGKLIAELGEGSSQLAEADNTLFSSIEEIRDLAFAEIDAAERRELKESAERMQRRRREMLEFLEEMRSKIWRVPEAIN